MAGLIIVLVLLLKRLCLQRHHAYKLAVLRTFLFEPDRTVGFGKQSMVTSYTDINTGMKFSAALADKNISGYDLLATELLNA